MAHKKVCLNCSDYVVSCFIYMLAVELNQAEGSCWYATFIADHGQDTGVFGIAVI